MKLHANHRTCPSSRVLICRRVLEEGWTLAQAAEAAGAAAYGAKWLKRYRDGDRELLDRRRVRGAARAGCRRSGAGDRGAAAAVDDGGGDRGGPRVAALDRLAVAEADRARQALAARAARAAQPLRAPPSGRARPRRHQAARPHLGARRRPPRARTPAQPVRAPHRWPKTGVTGYEYVHVMIDDHRRLAYAEVLDDLTARLRDRLPAPRGRLVCRTRRARAGGHDRQRLLLRRPRATGPPRELGLRQLRIRPGRPRTNGKAERFIQTLLNEWAYARIYGSSAERTAALPPTSSDTTTPDHTAPSANKRRPRD